MQKTANLGLNIPEDNEWADQDAYNENMEKLDGAFTTLPMTAVSAGSTEEEINNFYDNYSAELEDGTNYKANVWHNIAHSILDGGTRFLEGFKKDSLYEYQTVTAYFNNYVHEWRRSKYNGTWTPWKQVDIGNVLTASKNVYVSPSGDDTTGDGTQTKPWRSIQKAVDECPRIRMTDRWVTIYVAGGVYGSIIVDNQFIVIVGIDKPDIIINGDIRVVNNTRLEFNNVNSLTINPITGVLQTLLVFGNSYFYSNATTVTLNGMSELDSCIHANVNSYIFLNSTVYVNNALHGMIAIGNSTVHANYVYATDCENGVSADTGGALSMLDLHLSGTLARGFLTNCTGKIFTYSVDYANATFTDRLIGGSGTVKIGQSQGWQLIGSVIGANSVAFDSKKYTEIMIIQDYNGDMKNIIVSTDHLLTDSRKIILGGYGNYTDYVTASNTTITNGKNYNLTSDVTENTLLTVVGRRI